jgi:ADP-ribosyl-[dinitrogen reductase] hydrolase
MPTLRERIEGGLIGMLGGDALGVPFEFRAASRIPPREQIEFAPPHGYDRAHRRVPPGTWSDDGAQALALLASLLKHGRLDVEDFARRLVDWQDNGYMAVDGMVFDCGIQTGNALNNLRGGVPAREAGPRDERANGNGSLMRVLPLALWHQGTDAELAADAALQSLPTHGHPRSQVCCALYCLWARRIMQGGRDPWTEAIATARALYPEGSDERRELEWSIRPDEMGTVTGNGSGYVVDCLRSACWAVAQGDYETVVKAAIGLGTDTDTTACVAGGIAGLREGVHAIPERWRNSLRGQELVGPLLRELTAVR